MEAPPPVLVQALGVDEAPASVRSAAIGADWNGPWASTRAVIGSDPLITRPGKNSERNHISRLMQGCRNLVLSTTIAPGALFLVGWVDAVEFTQQRRPVEFVRIVAARGARTRLGIARANDRV